MDLNGGEVEATGIGMRIATETTRQEFQMKEKRRRRGTNHLVVVQHNMRPLILCCAKVTISKEAKQEKESKDENVTKRSTKSERESKRKEENLEVNRRGPCIMNLLERGRNTDKRIECFL